MMMNKIKHMIWPTIVGLVPLVVGMILYSQLPSRMPIHFGLNGQPNGYSGKFSGVILFPLLMVLANILIYLSLKYARQNNDKLKVVVIWIIPIISLVVQTMTIMVALGHKVNIGVIVFLLIGVIFIVLGNYMPKTTPNLIMGVRIPTTMKNPENWQKTNRLGGLMLVVAGAILILGGIIGIWSSAVLVVALIIGMILVVVVPIVYSIKLAHQTK
jgi:uncharacterized membrane protein